MFSATEIAENLPKNCRSPLRISWIFLDFRSFYFQKEAHAKKGKQKKKVSCSNAKERFSNIERSPQRRVGAVWQTFGLTKSWVVTRDSVWLLYLWEIISSVYAFRDSVSASTRHDESNTVFDRFESFVTFCSYRILIIRVFSLCLSCFDRLAPSQQCPLFNFPQFPFILFVFLNFFCIRGIRSSFGPSYTAGVFYPDEGF